jgi:hypothetical protein
LVFVHSTYFDRNRVRADERRFLIEAGLDPIFSKTLLYQSIGEPIRLKITFVR